MEKGGEEIYTYTHIHILKYGTEKRKKRKIGQRKTLHPSLKGKHSKYSNVVYIHPFKSYLTTYYNNNNNNNANPREISFFFSIIIITQTLTSRALAAYI